MSMQRSSECPTTAKHWASGVIATGLISMASLAPAYGADAIGLSGIELFIGKPSGDVVKGVLFAGVVHPPCNCFTTEGDTGTWIASVDRMAGGGIGWPGSLPILGGKLTVESEDVARTFRITGGSLTWPASLQQSITAFCGPGVAYFTATVAGHRTLTGCLDDTHLDLRHPPVVFPPHIWGTLQ
jgi:hypothetical protein